MRLNRILNLLFLLCLHESIGQFDSGMSEGRSTIVQMFEWPFNDIKLECGTVLGPQKFGGILVPPITENAIVHYQSEGKTIRPWWERYQPLSWKIISRSGNEQEFAEMVKECNKNGVRVYVDAVINHGVSNFRGAVTGVGGSKANTYTKSYPGFGYDADYFHKQCEMDFSNKTSVRICELGDLQDVDQSQTRVQDIIAAYLNKLIGMGVAGFRVDAAKHMWPDDLSQIYKKLKNVVLDGGKSMRPYWMLEVYDVDPGLVYIEDYKDLGSLYEILFNKQVLKTFTDGSVPFSNLFNYANYPHYTSKTVQAFSLNHDIQRENFKNTATNFSENDQMRQEMINTFMLTFPRGVPNIFSGFKYNTIDDGPPTDQNHVIISPRNCTHGWTCEHRSKPLIWVMKFFTNDLKDTTIDEWWSEWDSGAIQAAFTRGNRGFVAFNADAKELQQTFKVSLPPGLYCDLATGYFSNQHRICIGTPGRLTRMVEVEEDGTLTISLPGISRNTNRKNQNSGALEPPYLVISTKSMYPPENAMSDQNTMIPWIAIIGAAVVFIIGLLLYTIKMYS